MDKANPDKILFEVQDTFNISQANVIFVIGKPIQGKFEFGEVGKDFLDEIPLSDKRVLHHLYEAEAVSNERELITFVLKNTEDRSKFTKGQIVEYRVIP